MIFSGERNRISHIEMILNDFPEFRAHHTDEEDFIIKTQTRRWSLRVPVPVLYQRYRVGQLYAIQPGRTKPGLAGVKIKLTRKWIEVNPNLLEARIQYYPLGYLNQIVDAKKIPISAADALAEGGYTPEEFEVEFKRLNPKWPGIDRVGLEFKVI